MCSPSTGKLLTFPKLFCNDTLSSNYLFGNLESPLNFDYPCSSYQKLIHCYMVLLPIHVTSNLLGTYYVQSPIVADGDPVVNKEEKVPSLMEYRLLREIDMKLCVMYFKQRSLIIIIHLNISLWIHGEQQNTVSFKSPCKGSSWAHVSPALPYPLTAHPWHIHWYSHRDQDSVG